MSHHLLFVVAAAVGAVLTGQNHAYRDQHGVVRANGVRYEAEFTQAHARLSTTSTAGAVRPTLDLRYAGMRRGNLADGIASDAEPEVLGEHVRYRHGDVVEAYRIDARGFEQSFRVDREPAGRGDLVVAVDARGNVTAPAVAAAHQAVEFACGDRPAIRYGEAYAFDRGGARVDVLTSYDGLGRIELVVPAVFVDRATFPIVIDPLISPVFNPGGTSFQDSSPDIAYDHVNDRYLLVWFRVTGFAQSDIVGQIFDADGNPTTPIVTIGGGMQAYSPAVAFHGELVGGAFLVVWQESDRILGRVVSAASGAPLAPEFDVGGPQPGDLDRRPSVSGPGTGAMMVAWDRTPSGASEPKQIIVRDLYWQNPADPTVVAYGAERTLHSVISDSVQNVRLARSDVSVQVGGQEWFANRAVFEQFYQSPAPGDFDVRTVSFRFRWPFQFDVIDPVSTVPGAGVIGADDLRAEIGALAGRHSNPTDLQYCVAWQGSNDIYAHMFDLDAPVGSQISVRATSAIERSPVVSAGSCEFTIGYLEAAGTTLFDDTDVLAARVLRDGTVADSDIPIDVAVNPFQDDLAISSQSIRDQAGNEGNSSLLARHDVTGILPTNYSIQANFLVPMSAWTLPFGSPCPGPLGELPTIGMAGGPPHPGNANFQVTVSDAPAFSLAALVFSENFVTLPIPGAPGCSLYAGLPFLNVLPTVTDAVGDGAVSLPIPCTTPAGIDLAFQWAIYSPTANAFGWITSDDIDVMWN